MGGDKVPFVPHPQKHGGDMSPCPPPKQGPCDIAILAIMKKCLKPSNNSGTTQRTEMADPIFKSISHNMNNKKRFNHSSIQNKLPWLRSGHFMNIICVFKQVNLILTLLRSELIISGNTNKI